MTTNKPINNEWKEIQANALGSSTAGLIGRIICHPIDTAKSRLQSHEYTSYTSTASVLRATFRQEGWRGLYRGFGVVAVGGIPGTCIYLTAYETTKDILSTQSQLSSFLVYFLSGIVAEASCCIIFVPVDVIKERIQVQNISNSVASTRFYYRGSLDAAKKIIMKEGFAGIYRGYGATLLSYSPFSALYFLLYEETKTYLVSRRKVLNDTENFTYSLICSAFAGATASYITSPLDMAKLRLQIQRSNNVGSISTEAISYRGLSDVLYKVFQADGIKGLFRGAGARVFFHAPSTAITMAVFEECRRLWARLLY